MLMRCSATIAMAAMLAGGARPPDGILWDNGDATGSNGFSNGTAKLFGGRRSVLDDFVVPEGERWSLCGFEWLHVWDSLPPGSGTDFEFRLR